MKLGHKRKGHNGHFQPEKALVGAFFVSVKTDGSFAELCDTVSCFRTINHALHQKQAGLVAGGAGHLLASWLLASSLALATASL